jgi:hypothetical protein
MAKKKKAPKIIVSQELHEFFKRIGKKGGKVGGHAAAKALTAEQRRERARRAALARWDRHRP